MDKLEALKGALALISNPRAWTTGKPAANSKGVKVSIYDKSATQFCVMSSVARITGVGSTGDLFPVVYTQAVDHLHSVVESEFPDRFESGLVSKFNDHPDTKHKDIIRVLDLAIATCD